MNGRSRITHNGSPIKPDSTPREPGEEPGDNKIGASLPRVEGEPDEEIRVGAGGKLVIPREDFDAELDDSEELDLAGMTVPKIRKPGRPGMVRTLAGLGIPSPVALP